MFAYCCISVIMVVAFAAAFAYMSDGDDGYD